MMCSLVWMLHCRGWVFFMAFLKMPEIDFMAYLWYIYHITLEICEL